MWGKVISLLCNSVSKSLNLLRIDINAKLAVAGPYSVPNKVKLGTVTISSLCQNGELCQKFRNSGGRFGWHHGRTNHTDHLLTNGWFIASVSRKFIVLPFSRSFDRFKAVNFSVVKRHRSPRRKRERPQGFGSEEGENNETLLLCCAGNWHGDIWEHFELIHLLYLCYTYITVNIFIK